MEILFISLFFYIKTFFVQLDFVIRLVVFSISNVSEVFLSKLHLILLHYDSEFVDLAKGIIVVLAIVPNELKVIEKLVNILEEVFLKVFLNSLKTHRPLYYLGIVFYF